MLDKAQDVGDGKMAHYAYLYGIDKSESATSTGTSPWFFRSGVICFRTPMILSVSRRTDIPAFYADWFLSRVEEGFVLVRNPMNKRAVSRISLHQSGVDGIVFWTKNARPLMPRLPEIRSRYGDSFYFQYTLTAYDAAIEPSVPSLSSRIDTFKALSGLLGPDRVVWRYDPIFFTLQTDLAFHTKAFEEMANHLGPYTRRCVVSILDPYRKTDRNMAGLGARIPDFAEACQLLSQISQVMATWNIPVETCSESADYSSFGVGVGKCIDDRLISKSRGVPFAVGKDKSQRADCGCIPSIDIGTYNTCPHGCRYCYANFSDAAVQAAHAAYDPASPMLCDQLKPGDVVKERPMASLFPAQAGLWT